MAARVEAARLVDGELTEWEALVERGAGRRLFHSFDWIRPVADAFGKAPAVIGLFRGGALVGGCPVYEQRTRGLPTAQLPPEAGFGGALLELPASGGAVRTLSERQQLLDTLESELRRRYRFARIVHEPAMDDARAFLWSGWSVRARFACRIRLDEAGDVGARFGPRLRELIDRARSHAITARRVASVEEIADLGSGGAAIELRPQLRALIGALGGRGAVRFFAARDPDGKVVAYQLVVIDGSVGHAWLGGRDSTRGGEEGYALVVRELMRDLSSVARMLEFLVAETPAAARFQIETGAALVPYWETTHASAVGRALLGAGSGSGRGAWFGGELAAGDGG